jgi:hypothetical protein
VPTVSRRALFFALRTSSFALCTLSVPRFVILEHDGPRGLHWDLLLETGSTLATWALGQPPDAPGPIDAERLHDHRVGYLDYEGPVSGGRGAVRRWDTGTYEVVRKTDREWVVLLEGNRLRGTATLSQAGDDARPWLLTVTPTT